MKKGCSILYLSENFDGIRFEGKKVKQLYLGGEKIYQRTPKVKIDCLETETIQSGKKYLVDFPATSGNFLLIPFPERKYTYEVPENQNKFSAEYVWEITESDGKYVFSVTVDDKKMYLYRTSKFVNSGYDIGLTDDLESATFWDAQRISSTNKFRISHKKYRATYYLRYYNATRGWIASSTAGSLSLYRTLELDE